uniref:AXH domain-containing protein n=1 Tax=Setaria digitata TaxID=48799 RepID=A0A915Q7U2_9BILA
MSSRFRCAFYIFSPPEKERMNLPFPDDYWCCYYQGCPVCRYARNGCSSTLRGGSRQSEKAPPEGGPIRPPTTIRAPTQQQHPVVSVAVFPQQEEAGSICQSSTVPLSQAFPGVVQQSVAVREPFPLLHSPAVQHPMGGWSPQFEMQLLQSASSQIAAAGLRYSQPSTSQQPAPGTEITVGVSPLSSLPSPSISSASLLTGIGLTPGSGPGSGSGPGPGSSGQSSLQMLGAMNPALLAQYQVILAAAAQQHQVAAAAAAATLAAASGGRSPQIGSRVGPPSTPALTLEQNLQRHLLQLQQQQQLAASAGTAIHLLPSSPLHGTLMTQMHAALAAVGVLPQPPQAPSTHTTAQPTHPRVTPPAVTQSIPSLSAETSSRPSRVEFIQPQPLLSRAAVATARQALLLAATSHAAVAAATVTSTPTPSASALQLSTSQPYSQALGRVVMMPPPLLPRVRHVLTQERRRYAPYQRPMPTVPLASASTIAAPVACTGASEPSSFQVGTLPSQPYYSSHFMRGTMIRLQSGQLKRVEDMSTEDFVLSAAMKTDLVLCNSRVVRIREAEKDRQVLVTFAVGEQGIQVTIEAGIEHPYFVVDRGWASCNPERTRLTYGLVCRQLNVGDVCVALRHVETGETSGTSGRGTVRPQSITREESEPSTSGIQHLLRPTSSTQPPRRRPPLIIRAERRPGVRSAPPHDIPTEELAILEMRRRLRRHRHKSTL